MMAQLSVLVKWEGKITMEKLESLLAKYSSAVEVKPYVIKTKEELQEEYGNWKKRRFRTGAELQDCSTFKKWTSKYLESCSFDKFGNLLSTVNPNQKFDWWELGGQKKGTLVLKKGKTGLTAFGDYAGHVREAGYVSDMARYSSISWTKMKGFMTDAVLDRYGWHQVGKEKNCYLLSDDDCELIWRAAYKTRFLKDCKPNMVFAFIETHG